MRSMHKITVGLVERVKIIDQAGHMHELLAKIDTGADTSSIDSRLAQSLVFPPVLKTKRVVSSHGKTTRPVVKMTVVVAGRTLTEHFTVIDRGHMQYRILIGTNILKQGFLIDPSKDAKVKQ
jgi:hypothetical protein